MAAVAVRATTYRDEITGRRTQTVVRRRVRRQGQRLKFCWVVIPALVLGFFLPYMNMYARLAMTGHSRSRLSASLDAQRLMNQRLRIEYDSFSSPHNVVAAAQKGGMVYATQYDFIRRPVAVASAAGSSQR